MTDQTDICPCECHNTPNTAFARANQKGCPTCHGTGRIQQQQYTDSGGVTESGNSDLPKKPPKELSEHRRDTTEAVADGSIAALEKRVAALEGHIHMIDGNGLLDDEESTPPMVEGENNEGQEIWKPI